MVTQKDKAMMMRNSAGKKINSSMFVFKTDYILMLTDIGSWLGC